MRYGKRINLYRTFTSGLIVMIAIVGTALMSTPVRADICAIGTSATCGAVLTNTCQRFDTVTYNFNQCTDGMAHGTVTMCARNNNFDWTYYSGPGGTYTDYDLLVAYRGGTRRDPAQDFCSFVCTGPAFACGNTVRVDAFNGLPVELMEFKVE